MIEVLRLAHANVAQGLRSVAEVLDAATGPTALNAADLVIADAALAPEERILGMYRAAFARPPAPEEMAAALEFLALQTRAHGGDFAKDLRQEAAWADLAHALFNAKEFIFVP